MDEQQAQDELIRQTGIEAYAEAIAEMLSDVGQKNGRRMDEAQIEMIKQGISRTMSPPQPRLMTMPAMPPPMKNAQRFREETDKGITLYDWGFIIQQASHYHQFPNGDVFVFTGRDTFLELRGQAATAFWKWQEEAFKRSTWTPEQEGPDA